MQSAEQRRSVGENNFEEVIFRRNLEKKHLLLSCLKPSANPSASGKERNFPVCCLPPKKNNNPPHLFFFFSSPGDPRWEQPRVCCLACEEAPTTFPLQGAVDLQGSSNLVPPDLINDICVALCRGKLQKVPPRLFQVAPWTEYGNSQTSFEKAKKHPLVCSLMLRLQMKPKAVTWCGSISCSSRSNPSVDHRKWSVLTLTTGIRATLRATWFAPSGRQVGENEGRREREREKKKGRLQSSSRLCFSAADLKHGIKTELCEFRMNKSFTCVYRTSFHVASSLLPHRCPSPQEFEKRKMLWIVPDGAPPTPPALHAPPRPENWAAPEVALVLDSISKIISNQDTHIKCLYCHFCHELVPCTDEKKKQIIVSYQYPKENHCTLASLPFCPLCHKSSSRRPDRFLVVWSVLL